MPERRVAPILRADVIHLRACADDEVIDAAGKSAAVAIGGAEMFDQRDLRKLLRHEQRMRENRGILAAQPMESFERQFDLHAPRHVKKSARPNERLMERGIFRRAKVRRLIHEMAAEQILVLDHRPLERLEDHAGRAQLFRKHIALEQMVVGENQTARGFGQLGRTLEQVARIVVGERRAGS